MSWAALCESYPGSSRGSARAHWDVPWGEPHYVFQTPVAHDDSVRRCSSTLHIAGKRELMSVRIPNSTRNSVNLMENTIQDSSKDLIIDYVRADSRLYSASAHGRVLVGFLTTGVVRLWAGADISARYYDALKCPPALLILRPHPGVRGAMMAADTCC